MTTPPKELSPERCHQLREGGTLRLIVNLLHEHTFEPQNKSEADFNIELFLMDFKRKAELRARLSHQLRTIVEHTAKNADELKILEMLETLRKYIERLYYSIDDWKAITEDAGKLNECTEQLTKLAGEVRQVIIEFIQRLLSDRKLFDDEIRPIFEQFGGVFVIVDYIRAQTRFNANCHRFESAQIDSPQLLGAVNDSKQDLRGIPLILYSLISSIDSSKDIRLFLGNSRSLHEVMVGIVEDAYDNGELEYVQLYCDFICKLYDTGNLVLPPGVMLSTTHLKDSGVIKCLAKFGMNTKDQETLYYVLVTLETSLELDRQNVPEFVSIDGAVDLLIDVLVLSKEKDEDVENAEWYEKQRHYSMCLLGHISVNLARQDQMNRRLLAIYESRDMAAILVRYLEQITLIHEYSEIAEGVLTLLTFILMSSEDQRRKFTEIVNAKEVVKRFESSENESFVELSKIIGNMFE